MSDFLKMPYLGTRSVRDKEEPEITLIGHELDGDDFLVEFLKSSLESQPPSIGIGLKQEDISLMVELPFGDDYVGDPVWTVPIADVVDDIIQYGNVSIAKKVIASFRKYAAILDEWVEEEEPINSGKQGA